MPLLPNPDLDLVLDREIDVSCAFVWRAWTESDLLMQWFCPQPWRTVEAHVDARPGGIFRTVMRGPDGPPIDLVGCIVAVVPERRLVWTGALGPDFRPQSHGPEVPFVMTASIEFTPTAAGGTRYVATALHADAASRERHEAMGFHAGWSAALDQLVALAPRA